jgi:6-phosphofructokinase 1
MNAKNRFGILVGGGPAPGINSVIGAATIRSALDGADVVGIFDGFKWLMRGSDQHVASLTIEDVSRIHFTGGSCLRTSRANPTTDPALLERVVQTLTDLGITGLITIGGDDTAYSATRVAERAAGSIRVVHVPKTIDNDLALPPDSDTFGYQTARHAGVRVVKTLMTDAQTTARWYFAVAMGRKAGHLALGIGKAAAATITLVPEEFGEGSTRLDSIVDTLTGSIIKRLAVGRSDGVAVVAEGVVLGLSEGQLAVLEGVERDDHGHVRLAEVDVGGILKQGVKARLAAFGIQPTIVAKNIGYELRRRQRPPDHDAGRQLRAGAPRGSSGSSDGPDGGPDGGYGVHPIPDRATLHDSTPRQGLRFTASARGAGRRMRSHRGPIQRRIRERSEAVGGALSRR